jgi:Flp pilus assembly pilin Flp
MKFLPTPTEIAREALIVVGGAIMAAAIIGALPGLKAWIKKQWGDTPTNPL